VCTLFHEIIQDQRFDGYLFRESVLHIQSVEHDVPPAIHPFLHHLLLTGERIRSKLEAASCLLYDKTPPGASSRVMLRRVLANGNYFVVDQLFNSMIYDVTKYPAQKTAAGEGHGSGHDKERTWQDTTIALDEYATNPKLDAIGLHWSGNYQLQTWNWNTLVRGVSGKAVTLFDVLLAIYHVKLSHSHELALVEQYISTGRLQFYYEPIRKQINNCIVYSPKSGP